MMTKPKTVLVVDDDEDILKILNKILGSAGYHVLTALSPEEGRKIIEANPPHIIISDLNMAPEDGYSFIQSIRKQKHLKEIPVLVLSAINEFGTVRRVIALGISDYVIKPLQAPLLLRKMKKALLNKDFTTWTAPKEAQPVIEVKLKTEVVELGEIGYRISGPFKITPGKEVKITVPEFDSLGLNSYIHRASAMVKTYLSGGLFLNDITFIGTTEETSAKIRQYTKKSPK